MKMGLVWIIGWMFTIGMIFHDEPSRRLNFGEGVALFIVWPAVLGYEFADKANTTGGGR